MRAGSPYGFLAIGALSLAVAGGASAGGVATLGLEHETVYAGDPVLAHVRVTNDGAGRLRNPLRVAADAFRVIGHDAAPLPASSAGRRTGERPAHLAPGSSDEVTIDLAALFAGLREPGRYEIRLAAEGIAEPPAVHATILPRFDPARSYTARIETDLGMIEAHLFPQQSPIAVKAFVDLANAGAYDGLTFDEGQPGAHITGGDVSRSTPPRPPIAYPAEISTLLVVPGAIVMKPTGAAPPANGSSFIIALEPKPDWLGQVTVIGQLFSGLEVAGRISRALGESRARPRMRRVSVADRGPADGPP
jgi:cyclophilin family peptidyl-prolyl cis-trans isomerase